MSTNCCLNISIQIKIKKVFSEEYHGFKHFIYLIMIKKARCIFRSICIEICFNFFPGMENTKFNFQLFRFSIKNDPWLTAVKYNHSSTQEQTSVTTVSFQILFHFFADIIQINHHQNNNNTVKRPQSSTFIHINKHCHFLMASTSMLKEIACQQNLHPLPALLAVNSQKMLRGTYEQQEGSKSPWLLAENVNYTCSVIKCVAL